MFIPLVFKKSGSCMPENYRVVAFLLIPGKVFSRIILEKIREKTERFTRNTQCGLRSNRGTINAIFVIRQVMQKSSERGVRLHFNFVDFKNAFDKICRTSLWNMIRAVDINSNNIVNIIENIYNKTICSLVIDGYQTGWFEVVVGVRQGCLLSPTLFIMFLNFILQKVKCLQEKMTFDDDLFIDLNMQTMQL